MNKILIKLEVPLIEKKFEIFIPINGKICDILYLVVKAINEIMNDNYVLTTETGLYNKKSGERYSEELPITECNLENGINLMLI